ncbi:phosphate acyltransferase PlsX [uncultured Parolsenella sp.]|uniref:phosphate acyltransferase PlsX n=1 Tax=uncultured Parolsenella sp. TaxID=2083008 RepID=UPI0025F532DB|nr:phosphate acyltransferase PlsX [uncultured Parolsenella sp.]
MVRVVVDAMGGDEGPKAVLEGIERALAADEDLTVVVAGNEDVVVPFCAKHARTEALVTTEVIEMAEHPTAAVRAKRDSSIVRGCRAVRSGDADAFFSPGSTGAILAAGTLVVGRVKGVARAALATAMPGVNGHMTTFLDLGANADCTPEMIVQFARMGTAYAQIVLGVDDPTVGLLNNGTEDTKGSEAALARHEALAAAEGINFSGNCEGRDILTGPIDVIVTDGFTGNVALKTVEGTAKFIVAALKAEAAKSKRAGLGALMVKPALKGVASLLSGDAYGGAALLGLKAPVLVGHGATNPEAIMNGTLTAARCVRQDLCGKLAQAIASAK